MAQRNRARNLRMLSAFVGIVLACNAPVHAQSLTQGQPVVANSQGGPTTDGIYWDARQFTGSDICAQIFAAWQAALATGVTSATIDARGITGAQSCASSPFPPKANGRLLLGNTQITTDVTWQIPVRTHVEGLGVSGLGSGYLDNTVIRAGSKSADPVLQLGNNNGNSFSVVVKSLTVDAYGLATTGVLNNSSYEGTRLEDVNIYNASKYGLLIGQFNANQSGAASGPYRNLNILYNDHCPNCGEGTTGIGLISTIRPLGFPVRGIDNVTVSGHGTKGKSLGSCITVIAMPVLITNSHVEFCTTGIQIGATGGMETNNVQIQNVSTDPFNGWNITITHASDVLISGIEGFGGELLKDNVTNNKIMGNPHAISPLGFYLLGDGSNPAVLSTAATQSKGPLAWVAPGDLNVIGNLSKASGTFKIDDPVDPAHKYLYHSFVESPDMMNVYNGSAITDKHGRAVVALPEYFEKLNRDFRYQLTAIGSFAQATVAKEIQNNQFTIRTSKPGVKVSWQVTGIRQDAYAKAHPMQVEEEKPSAENGHYLHPELFDASKDRADPAASK
jgi:hypothetical protein